MLFSSNFVVHILRIACAGKFVLDCQKECDRGGP